MKEAWKSIQEGDDYYEQGKGTYDLARDFYLFANQYNPENPELNYKLGVCYLFTDNKYEAINYLYKAYMLNPEVSDDIHLMLGQAFQLVLEFDNAIEHYNAHMETLEPEEKMEYSGLLAKRLTECQHGRALAQEPIRVIIQNLGENVNSKYDDYNPLFAFGDSALFFTSRRPGKKSKRNPIDNKFNEDIFRASTLGAVFDTAVKLNKPYNTKYNDALVGISSEGDQLFVYRGNIDGGDIQVSYYKPEKGKWSRPKSISGKLQARTARPLPAFTGRKGTLLCIKKQETDTGEGRIFWSQGWTPRGNGPNLRIWAH